MPRRAGGARVARRGLPLGVRAALDDGTSSPGGRPAVPAVAVLLTTRLRSSACVAAPSRCRREIARRAQHRRRGSPHASRDARGSVAAASTTRCDRRSRHGADAADARLRRTPELRLTRDPGTGAVRRPQPAGTLRRTSRMGFSYRAAAPPSFPATPQPGVGDERRAGAGGRRTDSGALARMEIGQPAAGADRSEHQAEERERRRAVEAAGDGKRSGPADRDRNPSASDRAVRSSGPDGRCRPARPGRRTAAHAWKMPSRDLP